MRKQLLYVSLALLCFGFSEKLSAQQETLKALRPVITGNTLLCPNAESILQTQKIYDSYQWYKRDYFSDEKQPIPGATTNELKVSENDVLYYFSVTVKLKGLKRSSEEKLIDGLVFIPPTVQSSSDFKNGPGFFVLNEGDTGIFTLLQPYNTNITWYKNQQPITGVTSSNLPVTTAGTYTVSGAPATCPDYIQHLGVDLVVKVKKNNKKPVITGDTMLCPNGTGTLTTQAGYSSYKWYKRFYGSNDKVVIDGATTNKISINAYDDAPAYFSVEVINNGNTITSEEKLVDSYAFLPIAVMSGGDFINGPGYFLLNKGDTGTFTITQPYNTNISWYRNNAAISGEKSTTLNVTKQGIYTVEAAPAVCPDFKQTLGTPLGVKINSSSADNATKNELSSSAIKVYPNPAKDFVMVDVAAFKGKDISISLATQDGKIVIAKKYANADAAIKLDIAKINTGAYYIKINDGKKQEVAKLVIAK